MTVTDDPTRDLLIETAAGAPDVHPRFRLDRYTTSSDLTEMRFHSLMLDGGYPAAGSSSVVHESTLTDLVPAGFGVRSTYSVRGEVSYLLATLPDALLYMTVGGAQVSVRVAAPTEADVQRWLSVVGDLATVTETPDTIPASFWAIGRHGPSSMRRSLAAVRFADIGRNYNADSRTHLRELAPFGRQRNRGGLVVWFGPPGTGKTTAVRAMATEWDSDRELNVVTDFERLLQDADYLAEVTRPTDEAIDKDGGRAKLIVAEDVDPSLLSTEQAQGSGGLARLLGLTDGLLASATDAIVVLTTNARRHQIAPSIQRPGRCLALVEFGPLSTSEANEWLPADVPRVTEPTMLAELFHRAGLVDRIGKADTSSSSVGTYL